jgi:hypothetical protein
MLPNVKPISILKPKSLKSKSVKELFNNTVKRNFTVPDGNKDHGEDEVFAE